MVEPSGKVRYTRPVVKSFGMDVLRQGTIYKMLAAGQNCTEILTTFQTMIAANGRITTTPILGKSMAARLLKDIVFKEFQGGKYYSHKTLKSNEWSDLVNNLAGVWSPEKLYTSDRNMLALRIIEDYFIHFPNRVPKPMATFTFEDVAIAWGKNS